MSAPTVDDLGREARSGTAGIVIIWFLIVSSIEAGISPDEIGIALAVVGALSLSFLAADVVEAAVGRVRQ